MILTKSEDCEDHVKRENYVKQEQQTEHDAKMQADQDGEKQLANALAEAKKKKQVNKNVPADPKKAA